MLLTGLEWWLKVLTNEISISYSEGTSFQAFINGIFVQRVMCSDRRKDIWVQEKPSTSMKKFTYFWQIIKNVLTRFSFAYSRKVNADF